MSSENAAERKLIQSSRHKDIKEQHAHTFVRHSPVVAIWKKVQVF